MDKVYSALFFSPFDITDLKLSLFVVLVGKKSLSILYSLDNLLAFFILLFGKFLWGYAIY